jgi:hypothetical protein
VATVNGIDSNGLEGLLGSTVDGIDSKQSGVVTGYYR